MPKPSFLARPQRAPHGIALAAALALLSTAGQAADAPPGMQLQQPLPPQPTAVQPGPVLPAAPAPRPAAPAASSGTPQITLGAVVLQGNARVDSARLLAAIGPLEGRRFDLPALQGLADAVTLAYRRLGYPFTTAVLPPQNLSSGRLTIQVIEGTYGRIAATGDDPLATGAQAFLAPHLHAGDVIQDRPLERAMLLLNDQPGFRVQPALRPGAQRGEGDLDVRVERRNHWTFEAGLDNAGSRATGAQRARAALTLNSPWRFGDRLSVNALVTDRQMWLGSVDYEAPLNGHGLRGALSLARNSYQLDGAFAAVESSGRADVASARLSHAALRSQRMNLLLTLNAQSKSLRDDFGNGLLVRDKRSRLLIASAQFDRRDDLFGGGVSYGSAGATWGHLSLDADAAAVDASSAQTAGSFHKWNLDLARIQKLPGPFSAYLRVSGQQAGKNLDASEKFGVGGFLGVRAYPMGEASGDSGWLGQLELRMATGPVTLFAFHDQGQVRTNQRPWTATADPRRRIAGAGLGLRWAHRGWSLEATLAERTQGGAPLSDSRDDRPRAFVVLGHRWD